MRRWLAIAGTAVAIAAAIAGCGGDAKNTIVLYSGQHPQLTNALVAAFTRETGIHVKVRSDDGIVLADQILQEGSDSPADAYLTENSPELMNLQDHGLLAKLSNSILDQIPARYNSPTGHWVGVALRLSALAYDPAALPSSQLPRSVLELAQPQWKGKIGLAPTDSDFPPVVGAVIARYGTAAASRWLDGLKLGGQIFQDDEAVVAAVNRGDVAAGLINHYYWFRLRVELGTRAVHSRLYYFPNHDVGSIENISGAAVLASSSNKALAERFVQFLVGPTGQRIIARGYDFEYPARPGIAANPALPPIASISRAQLPASALGTDQQAAQLIQQAGLA